MPTLRAVRGIALYGCAAMLGATYAYFRCERWGHAAVSVALVAASAAVALVCDRIIDRREWRETDRINRLLAEARSRHLGPVGATGPAPAYVSPPLPGATGPVGPRGVH